MYIEAHLVARLSKKISTGSRLKLGEPWDSDLIDFCEAHHGASATQVIRNALRGLIDAELKRDAGTRERFEAARQKRLGFLDPKISILVPKGE
jgi:hypothetical protein